MGVGKMAIIAQRKRVIDTFVAKELAKSNDTMINNTSVYRALRGEKIYKEEEPVQKNDITKQYEDLLSRL